MQRATYDEIRHSDLSELRFQARPACEPPLQERDHDVAQRRADEGAVQRHLRHAAGEVMTMFATVFGYPGRQ